MLTITIDIVVCHFEIPFSDYFSKLHISEPKNQKTFITISIISLSFLSSTISPISVEKIAAFETQSLGIHKDESFLNSNSKTILSNLLPFN